MRYCIFPLILIFQLSSYSQNDFTTDSIFGLTNEMDSEFININPIMREVKMSLKNINPKIKPIKISQSDKALLIINDSICNSYSLDSLNNIDPKEVASLNLVKDIDSIRFKGIEADYIIQIYTKDFIRPIYWNFLKSKSANYSKAVPTLDSENQVVYIINGEIYRTSFESKLIEINDTNLTSIKVIKKMKLKRIYSITDKGFGIIIKSLTH